MRVEVIDMVEFVRRMEEGIYDPDEFETALAWVKENCTEGKDYNPAADQQSRGEQGRGVGDLGQDGADCPRPDGRQPQAGRVGLRRRGAGPQCHRLRLPGPAPVDRPSAQRRLPGGDPQLPRSTGTASAQPYIVATENDALNGVSMLLGPSADQHGPDLRRRAHLLEPGRGQARHRLRIGRRGGRRHPASDQLRPGDPGRHRPAADRRPAGHEALLGDHAGRGAGLSRGHHLARGHARVLPRRRLVHPLPHRAAACR